MLKQNTRTLEPDMRKRRPRTPRKKPPSRGTAKVLIIGVKTMRMDVTVPYDVRIFNGFMCEFGKGMFSLRLTSLLSLQKRMKDFDVSKQLMVVFAVKSIVITTPVTNPAWLHSERGGAGTAW